MQRVAWARYNGLFYISLRVIGDPPATFTCDYDCKTRSYEISNSYMYGVRLKRSRVLTIHLFGNGSPDREPIKPHTKLSSKVL